VPGRVPSVPRSEAGDARGKRGATDQVEVRAAGGIILRQGELGTEVAVVHRPYRRDWTYPKGKQEPGESDEECALREVLEETGLCCAIERYGFDSRYADNRSRSKLVRYFIMQVIDGEFAVNDEVDELRFVTLPQAVALLTYERDREIARALDHRSAR
jgi:8-oxo-dGTP pyrophosphatase MutT (NUDIX family)